MDTTSLEHFLESQECERTYNNVIESLKGFEGLRLEPYYCPAGYKTIGYGHLIKPEDRIPSLITESVADSLLRADFDIAVREVQRLTGYDMYKDTEKLFALAHFVFNIGSFKFETSTLLERIKMDKPVDYELMKWVHYRTPDSTLMVSNQLKRMRQYEVKLYNS
jgi:lysozyme